MAERILDGLSTDSVRFVLVESGEGGGWAAEQRVRHGDDWVLIWATAFVSTEHVARQAIYDVFGI
jgi:hypothetical protein